MANAAARYNRARFLDSITRMAALPPESGREIAFAGRSNAGKSSALNAITGRRALARTSKTPGRTRMINLFDLGDDCRFADLPGYGYARVAREMREQWHELLTRYLLERRCLVGTVLVADSRRGLTDLDRRLIGLVAESGHELHVLLTKADKLGRNAGMKALEQVRREVEEAGVTATLQLFSATARTGIEDVHGVLDEWLEAPTEEA